MTEIEKIKIEIAKKIAAPMYNPEEGEKAALEGIMLEELEIIGAYKSQGKELTEEELIKHLRKFEYECTMGRDAWVRAAIKKGIITEDEYHENK